MKEIISEIKVTYAATGAEPEKTFDLLDSINRHYNISDPLSTVQEILSLMELDSSLKIPKAITICTEEPIEDDRIKDSTDQIDDCTRRKLLYSKSSENLKITKQEELDTWIELLQFLYEIDK